jgi:hypothetical protein
MLKTVLIAYSRRLVAVQVAERVDVQLSCIVLANIAIELMTGEPMFSWRTGNEDKAFVVCSLARRLPGTTASVGQSATHRVARDCCPAFRHWRDLASASHL